MFREFKQHTHQGSEKKSSGKSTHPNVPGRSHPPKIKELYRLLVRRLHPDSGADYHGEAGRLWNELQVAYKANDLERLEILLAATEIHDNEGSPRTTLFHLRQVTAEFLRTERTLKAQFTKLRKSPAGRLESAKNSAAFATELKAKIGRAITTGGNRLRQLENLIASWKTPAQSHKPKPARSASKKPKAAEAPHPDQQIFNFF